MGKRNAAIKIQMQLTSVVTHQIRANTISVQKCIQLAWIVGRIAELLLVISI